MDQASPNSAKHEAESRDRFNRYFQYDLHDCLNMLQFRGILEAELLAENLKKEGSPHAVDAERLMVGLRKTYKALHMLLEMAQLQDKPIRDALTEYADQFDKNIQLAVTGDDFFIRFPQVSEALFVIAREAIANAIQHANARHITIDLSGSSTGFTLKVKDDGIGFNTTALSVGHGIPYMNEIAESFGGELTIASESNNGTVVTVSIPSR